jgi:hypothetical protein
VSLFQNLSHHSKKLQNSGDCFCIRLQVKKNNGDSDVCTIGSVSYIKPSNEEQLYLTIVSCVARGLAVDQYPMQEVVPNV